MNTETDMNSFCRTHWVRLCGIARSRGLDEHEMQDAVQDVFMRLLRRDRLAAVTELPTPEHQAAYLTIRLHRELHHRWRAGQRQRRGSGVATVSLSDETVTFREPSHERTAEWQMNIAWVNEVLEKALARLRHELKPEVWDLLGPALQKEVNGAGALSGSVRVALSRARHRLREMLTSEVEGAASPRAAASELFRALNSSSCSQ